MATLTASPLSSVEHFINYPAQQGFIIILFLPMHLRYDSAISFSPRATRLIFRVKRLEMSSTKALAGHQNQIRRPPNMQVAWIFDAIDDTEWRCK